MNTPSLTQKLCIVFSAFALFAVPQVLAQTAPPVISNVIPALGEIQEEGEIIISASNIPSDEDLVRVTIGGKSAEVLDVYGSSIQARLPKNVVSGDVVVTVNGEQSNAFYLAIPRPHIDFLFSEKGFIPGEIFQIHGAQVLQVGHPATVYLDDEIMEVVKRDFANQVIHVRLPFESVEGTLTVEVNSLTSNNVKLEATEAFYVKGALYEPRKGVVITGLFPEEEGLDIYLENTKLVMTKFGTGEIWAELPESKTGTTNGILTVRYNNIQSNGVYLRVGDEPKILDVTEIERVRSLSSDGTKQYVHYEFSLDTFNADVPETQITVFMNGKELRTERIVSNRVVVGTTRIETQDDDRYPFGLKGTMYIKVNDVRGPDYEYDITKFVAPNINSIYAPSGFGSRKKIEISGSGFGTIRSLFSIVSSAGVEYNADLGTMYLPEYSSGRAVFRLPDLKKDPAKGTVQVVYKGVPSNTITYEFKDSEITVEKDPEIYEVFYKEGHNPGATVHVRGTGFSQFLNNNIIHLPNKTQTFPNRIVGTTELYFTIPDGATEGEMYISKGVQESEKFPFYAVPGSNSSLQFTFEEPKTLVLDSLAKEVVVGTLAVRNYKGLLELNKLRFDVVYNDAHGEGTQFHQKTTSILPIRYMVLDDGENEYKVPVVRSGTSYAITFEDVSIPVSSEKQVWEIRAQFTELVASGSTIHLLFNPGALQYIEGSFPDRNERYESGTSSTSAGLKSPEIELVDKGLVCIDSKSNQENCNRSVIGGVLSKAVPTVESGTNESTTTPLSQRDDILEDTPRVTETTIDSNVVTRGSSSSFEDMENVAWAIDAVERLYDQGIIGGYTENGTRVFAPAREVTRAELLKMALEATGHNAKNEIYRDAFADVSGGEWYAPYLQYAKNAGLVEGYADGTYKPNSPVRRAEAVKILLSVKGVSLYGATASQTNFPDVSGWSEPWVRRAFDLELVRGYSDGTFRPGNFLSRAEAAAIVAKLLDL